MNLLFLTLFTLCFLFVKVSADEYTDTCSADTGWTYKELTGFLDNAGITISRFYNKYTGKIGFCLDPTTFYQPCNGGYSKDIYNSHNTKAILEIVEAFENMGASDEYYIAAQLMIWETVGIYHTINGDNGYNYGRGDLDWYIRNKKQPAVLGMEDDYIVPFNKETVIEVSSGNLDDYTIVSDDIKNIRVVDNSLHLTVTESFPQTKTIRLIPKHTDPYDVSASFVYRSPSSQTIYSYEGNFYPNYEEKTIRITIQTGNMTLEKYDELGQPVDQPLCFELYDENGNLIRPAKTDSWILKNGKLEIKDLAAGNYYLIELKNDYYEDYQDKIPFRIESNQNTKIRLSNKNRDVDLYFEKTDEDGNPIKNAQFELYELDDKGNDEVIFISLNKITDLSEVLGFDRSVADLSVSERFQRYLNGTLIDPKEIGSFVYTLETETEIKKGTIYVTDDLSLTEGNYRIFHGNKLYSIKSGHKYLQIVDRNDHNRPLGNHQIIIYGKNGNVIGEYTSDKQGLISLDRFPEGDYYYVLDDIRTDFSVDEQSMNMISYLKMNKKYLLCESKPADGYVYDNMVAQLINTNMPETYKEISFINKERSIDLQLMKQDNEGILLNGAIFEVNYLNSDHKKVIRQFITGGHIFEENGYSYLFLKKEDDSEIQKYETKNQQLVLDDLDEGMYLYYFSDDEAADESLFIESFEVKKGGCVIDEIPYFEEIEIREIKAPKGYFMDEEVYKIHAKADYYKLSFENYRINNLLLLPYYVVDTCTKN